MEAQDGPGDQPVQSIQFHYSRSPDCRTIVVQGAYGGLTGSGVVCAHLYAEGALLPKVIELPIEDGVPQTERVLEPAPEPGVKSIMREVQAVVVIPIGQARVIAKWLNQKCDEWERLTEEASAVAEEEEPA